MEDISRAHTNRESLRAEKKDRKISVELFREDFSPNWVY